MMKSLILICATAVAQPDCSMQTAAAVVQGPDVGGPATCGLHGQAYLAATALAGYLQDGHYLKISCRPEGPTPGVPLVQRYGRGHVADNRLDEPRRR